MRFRNREDAGKRLAEALSEYRGKDAMVLALPRGGVVLGAAVAREIGGELDLMIARKIGHPLDPEYAVCAVAEEGEPFCNPAEKAQLEEGWLKEATRTAREEIRRRRARYLGKAVQPGLEGRIVLLVDDGVATGLTMLAAIDEVKRQRPGMLVVAVPVAPADTARALEAKADRLVALVVDEGFLGYVGAYYEEFEQVEDEEVLRLLKEFRADRDRGEGDS